MMRSLSIRLLVAAPLCVASTAVAFAQAGPGAPVVTLPSSTAVSPALRDLPVSAATPAQQQPKIHPPPQPLPPRRAGPGRPHDGDDALQKEAVTAPAVQGTASFPGIDANGAIPPDANIDVGPQHIIQVVNSEVAVFDKFGNLIGGPVALGFVWRNLGGSCAKQNAGDPIVHYDRFSNRWIITQLGSVSRPYSECIAISTSGDPLGSYFLYQYNFGRSLNDYPKFGVWPTATDSAYLASYNMFRNGLIFTGAQLCAYDRDRMFLGQPAASICFPVSNDGGFLPSDTDGTLAPSNGSPGYFLNFETLSSLRLYKLRPDFATPSNSTLTRATPDIPVAAFGEACNGGTCIPQAGTTRQLDSLGDRLMYRLAYRNFGTYEAMVVNHAITAGSAVGVRWYELRASTPGQFGLFQQGTFSPNALYRWMGSIAMNAAGQMALGYSTSSSTAFPGIAVTARCPATALGAMGPETVLQAGGGSQTGFTRWGDYTSMRVDPSDDMTFWYTNEYYSQTSSSSWKTAISSFTIGSCPP